MQKLKINPSTALRIDGEQSRTIKNQKCNLKLKIFAFCVVVLAFAFYPLNFCPTTAYAQELSLGIYPPLLEVMMQPGKSITQVYKIYNSGATDLVMTSAIVPFQIADEYGNIVIRDTQEETRNTGYGIRDTAFLSWFYFQNADLSLGQKFVIKAGKSQEVVLKIKVPENSTEDDYYATLFFETIPSSLAEQTLSAQALAKIGGNILLTVSKTGEPPKKASIEEFSIVNAFLHIGKVYLIDSFDAPVFNLRLANIGKAYFKPIGAINISGWLGQNYSLSLLQENVLAYSQRMINCQEPVTEKRNNYGPCRLKKKFLLGGYTARVGFGLDKPDSQHSANITFLSIPVKLIVGLLAVILLLFMAQNMRKLPLDKELGTS